MTRTIEELLALFDRVSDRIYSRGELIEKLRSGRSLRIKYSMDAAAAAIHIEDTAGLWLLRALQDEGHKVIFVIDDFEQGALRPVSISGALAPGAAGNPAPLVAQAREVLRFDDEKLIEVLHSSAWLEKMPLREFLELTALAGPGVSVARGYDAVAAAADISVVTPRNLAVEKLGRVFQDKKGQAEQVIVTTKFVPDVDIDLGMGPRDKFGGVMKVQDSLIGECFRLYTDVPLEEIAVLESDIRHHPREARLKLAVALVARYHGNKVAEWERAWFEDTFLKGEMPDDIPTLSVLTPVISVLDLASLARPGKERDITLGLVKQGGVEVNGKKLTDPDERIVLKTNDVLKAGRRDWFRIEIVGIDDLETERLWMKPLQIKDIDLIQKYIPQWDIVKYLGKLSVPKEPAAPAAVAAVFTEVIRQPEPKTEWLWSIAPKQEPENIIGVAHLRRDEEQGNKNIWLDPAQQGKGYAAEAVAALNDHAFNVLGFEKIVVKDAFTHAAPRQEMESLRKHFASLDAANTQRLQAEAEVRTWNLTREHWQKLREALVPKKP